MKLFTFKNVTMTIAAAAAMITALPASAESRTSRFAVPFQFTVGDQVLPQGTYDVTVDESRLIVRSVRSNKIQLIQLSAHIESRSHENLEAGRLRFTKTGDTLSLTAAWAHGQEDARTVAPTRHQKEVMRSANGAAAENVVLNEQPRN